MRDIWRLALQKGVEGTVFEDNRRLYDKDIRCDTLEDGLKECQKEQSYLAGSLQGIRSERQTANK